MLATGRLDEWGDVELAHVEALIFSGDDGRVRERHHIV